MYLLDTNVISEYLRARTRNQGVVDWFNNANNDELYTTVIVKAELLSGAKIAKHADQRERLSMAISSFFETTLEGRVYSFTENTANYYATVVANRMKNFGEFSQIDMTIAAIALENGYTVVTRNVKDFKGSGVEYIDPFD